MNAFAALEWCIKRNVRITYADGELVFDGVEERIPDAVYDALKENKELVARLVAGTTTIVGDEAWEPDVTWFSDVQPEQARWFWQGRIPIGKVTVFDGDPGIGKSTITLDLAARASTGDALPDGTPNGFGAPVAVVVMSAEDGDRDTIRPRLDAAGADVTKVAALEMMKRGDEERGITLDDLPVIECTIVRTGAKLLIVDPLFAYLDEKTNSYRDQDMRRILRPLARLAAKHGVAFIVIRHPTKAQNPNAVYRGGGTIGIIGAARVGLFAGRDPEDPERQRFILAVAKNNLAPIAPSLVYQIVGANNGSSHIVWGGESPLSANALSMTEQPMSGGERTALDEAKEVLRTILADGPVPSKEAERSAIAAGCAPITVRRARESLGIKPRREGGLGKDGVWYWELPPPVSQPALPLAHAHAREQNDEHLRESMIILGENGGENAKMIIQNDDYAADHAETMIILGEDDPNRAKVIMDSLRCSSDHLDARTETPPDTHLEARDRRWAETILASDWGDTPLAAPEFVRLAERGYGVSRTMSERAAARMVLAALNGGKP